MNSYMMTLSVTEEFARSIAFVKKLSQPIYEECNGSVEITFNSDLSIGALRTKIAVEKSKWGGYRQGGQVHIVDDTFTHIDDAFIEQLCHHGVIATFVGNPPESWTGCCNYDGCCPQPLGGREGRMLITIPR